MTNSWKTSSAYAESMIDIVQDKSMLNMLKWYKVPSLWRLLWDRRVRTAFSTAMVEREIRLLAVAEDNTLIYNNEMPLLMGWMVNDTLYHAKTH